VSAAVVPVKRLSSAKSRLLPELPREALSQLTVAMLVDVVAALRATPSLERVAVVTPDAEVAREAERAGAVPLLRTEPGLNASIDAACVALALSAGEPLLVVLGDVAGAASEELEALFDALRHQGGGGVVLAPSRDGGSSALLRAPWDAIPSLFGRESAAAHREAARRAALPFTELALPSLAIDLDRPDDIALFLASKGAGAKTRALLKRLGWKAGTR